MGDVLELAHFIIAKSEHMLQWTSIVRVLCQMWSKIIRSNTFKRSGNTFGLNNIANNDFQFAFDDCLQMMPLFVVDAMGNMPGLPGIFVSGIFSASLSSVSAAMNSLAAVTLEDYIKVQNNVHMSCDKSN